MSILNHVFLSSLNHADVKRRFSVSSARPPGAPPLSVGTSFSNLFSFYDHYLCGICPRYCPVAYTYVDLASLSPPQEAQLNRFPNFIQSSLLSLLVQPEVGVGLHLSAPPCCGQAGGCALQPVPPSPGFSPLPRLEQASRCLPALSGVLLPWPARHPSAPCCTEAGHSHPSGSQRSLWGSGACAWLCRGIVAACSSVSLLCLRPGTRGRCATATSWDSAGEKGAKRGLALPEAVRWVTTRQCGLARAKGRVRTEPRGVIKPARPSHAEDRKPGIRTKGRKGVHKGSRDVLRWASLHTRQEEDT